MTNLLYKYLKLIIINFRDIIHTIKTALTEIEDRDLLERWSNEDNLSPDWDSRSELIASLIPENASVLEFGAGRMVLKNYLKASIDYQPSDIVPRSPEFIVFDLNNDKINLQEIYSHAVFSGVLEYVRDIGGLISQIGPKVSVIIASYCGLNCIESRVARKKNGWVSHLSEDELLKVFGNNSFSCKSIINWRDQKIYTFERIN